MRYEQSQGVVSIDFDTLDCYTRIHALRLPEPALHSLPSRDPLSTVAVERFGELMARHGLLGTAFVIGSTLRDSSAAKSVKALADAGHELGNHSHHHDYRLSLRDAQTIQAELSKGAEAIQSLTGRAPLGFRAPGYNLSAALRAGIESTGHRYDSSVFPSLPYLAARAAVLTAMALRGQASASHAGPATALLAPRGPYRVHPKDFFRRGRSELLEFPISVLPGLGLPLIGTAVTSLPWPLMKASLALFRRQRWLNLELHGIDFLDRSDGLPEALVERQRDLKVPFSEKLRRLDATLLVLKEARALAPLATHAATFE